MHRTYWVQEVWQIRGRHFSTVRRIFSRQKCARMSARSARDSIMRPPRHQESRTSEARDSCCLPARRLWNLDLPPPTSHHNVRPRVPGMTTPAISLSLLSFPSQLSDPFHRLQRSPARPFHHRATNLFPQLHPKPKNPRDHLDLARFT